MLGLFMLSSDAGVVRRVRAGRKEEFSILVDRYYNLVHSIAFAHTGNTADAEEIAQESFLRAYAGLDSLRDGGRFRAWLGSIARNLSRNRLREQSREVSLSEVAEPATENDAASAELYALLWECIERLDESSREVLVLHYFERLKLRAAADLLDVTPAAAAKRLQRAREALGADLLSRLEQKPQRERNHGRARKTTVAAVAGSVVAWEASATGLSLGGLGLAAAALVVMAGSGAVVYSSITSDAPVEKAPTEQMPSEAVLAPNAASVVPVVEAEGEAEAAPVAALRTPNGPGTLEIRALRPDGTPAAGLALRVERIDWKEKEWPPAQPIAEEFTLDEKGEAVITGLSFGLHGVVVSGDNLMGVNDITLTKEYPKRGWRHFELLPAAPMRARVTLPDGSPAVGAVVYGHSREDYPSQEFEHGPAAALRAYADSEGRIALPYVWPGAYRLYARTQDGHAALSDFVSTSDENKIALQAPGALQGQVVIAGTERPAAGVKVMVASDSRRDGGNVVSDSAGRFAFAQLRPDDYHVYVDDAVMINTDASVKDNVSVASGAMAEVTIEATPGGVVMGRAYDKTTGVGIPDVVLLFSTDGHRNFTAQEATTDVAGSYYIGRLPAKGVVRLESAEEKATLYRLAPEAKGKVATLEAGKETEVDIPMIPAAVITGKVLDADGRPVDSGDVYARSETDWYTVSIQPDGSFRLGGQAGHALSLWAESGDALSPYFKFSPVPEEGSSDVALQLTFARSGSIQGTVRLVSGGGAELTSAEAMLKALDETCPCESNAGLVGGRTFEMERLVPGKYLATLVTRYSTNPIDGATVSEVTVLPGEVSQVEIVMESKPTRRILGQVVDTRGNPVAEARLHIDLSLSSAEYQFEGRGYQYSNRRGRFRLSTPATGRILLRVDHEEYASRTVEIEEGDADLKITLDDPLSLPVTVRDAHTGAAISDFKITGAETNDAGGRLTLEKLEVGQQLTFTAPGYATQNHFVQQEWLDPPAPLDILMEPGLSLSTRVVNSIGQPVEGAILYRYSIDGYPYNRGMSEPIGVSDAEGRLALLDLASEPFMAEITHPDYATLAEEFHPASTKGEQRFVLDGGGVLECTLELASSDTSWTLAASISGHPQREIELVDAGVYGGRRVFKGKLDKIVPGSKQLWARVSNTLAGKDAHYSYEFPIEVATGKSTQIRKTVEIPSASLEVAIMGNAESASLFNTYYCPGSSNNAVASGVPMGEGLHQFLALPPGPGSVRIEGILDGAQSNWNEPVNLVAGQTERITLGFATLELPECQGCEAMIATPEGYAALQEAANADAEGGEGVTYNLPGTLIFPVFESTQQVLIPAGEYYVALFGGQDEANPTMLEEALPNAVRLNLHAGTNGLAPLE